MNVVVLSIVITSSAELHCLESREIFLQEAGEFVQEFLKDNLEDLSTAESKPESVQNFSKLVSALPELEHYFSKFIQENEDKFFLPEYLFLKAIPVELNSVRLVIDSLPLYATSTSLQ